MQGEMGFLATVGFVQFLTPMATNHKERIGFNKTCAIFDDVGRSEARSNN